MSELVLDYTDLNKAKKLSKLLEQRNALKANNGSAFYEPHLKQDLFHRGADKFYRYVRTGNRWGKSQCGAAEDVAWARGFREWYPEGDPARYSGIPKRSTKGVILVYDWSKAEEIFTNQVQGTGRGKLFDYIPTEDFLGTEKSSGGNISCIKVRCIHGGVSTIYIDTVKSFIQNPLGHESSQWDWVHVDEPIPEDMWKAYARGLMDNDGKAWFLCTPLDQPWINDFFIPSRRTKLNEDSKTDFGDKMVIIGSTKDNPHISESARLKFEGLLSDEEIECRLHGIPRTTSGLVYKAFNHMESPEGHTYVDKPIGWFDEITPPMDYTIRYAIDTHPKTPHAVLFAATAPTGEVFFFREIFQQCLMKDLAFLINDIVQNRLVLTCLCDPSAYINNPVSGDTMADDLAAHGVVVEKAVKDLQRGVLAVQAALRKKMPGGHYWLNFHQGLTTTLWEFDHYMWSHKHADKVLDKNDHMMECLYRLVLNGLDYIDPEDSSDYFVAQRGVNNLNLSIPAQSEPSEYIDLATLTPEQRYEYHLLGLI
tara:strand:- start:31291 stop:32901 length:1611 start_codon:yes stop_codon:yes gene_type:complete